MKPIRGAVTTFYIMIVSSLLIIVASFATGWQGYPGWGGIWMLITLFFSWGGSLVVYILLKEIETPDLSKVS